MAKRNDKPQPHSAAKLKTELAKKLKQTLTVKPDKHPNKSPNKKPHKRLHKKPHFPYQRQLKVRKGHYEYQYSDLYPRINHCPEPVPWVNIKGYWLKQAGFLIGTELLVTIRKGEIIIAVAGRSSGMH